MDYLLRLNDWSKWNRAKSLEPWQWAALSVELPPDKLADAIDLACGTPDDFEQWRDFQKRKSAIEAAVRDGEVLGKQQVGPLTNVDQVVWSRVGGQVPVESFVGWAVGEKLTLPSELARRRSKVERSYLERKYCGIVPNIISAFKNQTYEGKRTASSISLQERASVDNSRGRDTSARALIMWDEYSVLYWLRGSNNF